MTTTALCGWNPRLDHAAGPTMGMVRSRGTSSWALARKGGLIDPTRLIARTVKLEDAPEACRMSYDKEEGLLEVVSKPGS